ncbi:MAG: fumarylacetoacetate hydrolase family protein [Pirellulaceae bacterium]|nr:fumarylacetoacetate hydrolase family protein [Pirellulaceae bacterium]
MSIDDEQYIRSFRDFYSFEQHVSTCRKRRGLEMVPQWYEVPVFYFSNCCSLVHDQEEIVIPSPSVELDFELELGLVIGKKGRDISPEDSWDYVAGLTIVNDFSARDLQRQEMQVGLGPAKGKDFATAVGPELVLWEDLRDRLDEKGNLQLEMKAFLNGKQISHGNAKDMYYSWPQLIAHASRNVTLYPGDLLGSGTVGTGCILELGPETTGGWLTAGDEITLEIEGLGQLTNRIVEKSN